MYKMVYARGYSLQHCISQVWKQLKSWFVGDYITASVSIKRSITELLKKNKAALYALYKSSSKDVVLTEKDQYTACVYICINIFEYVCLDSSCSYIHRMDDFFF